MSIAPTLIAGSGLVARVVPASSRTEGFTWQATGINAGVAAGAALGGVLIDAISVRGAFVVGPGWPQRSRHSSPLAARRLLAPAPQVPAEAAV